MYKRLLGYTESCFYRLHLIAAYRCSQCNSLARFPYCCYSHVRCDRSNSTISCKRELQSEKLKLTEQLIEMDDLQYYEVLLPHVYYKAV